VAALTPPAEGISIAEIPARDVAAIPVPGKPGDRLFASKTAELRRWIKGRGLSEGGAPEHAYYNSPLEPGTSLPNEILIALQSAAT
jgi:hypothetical protein